MIMTAFLYCEWLLVHLWVVDGERQKILFPDLKTGHADHLLTCMYILVLFLVIFSMEIYQIIYFLKPNGSWIYCSKPLRLLCVCV